MTGFDAVGYVYAKLKGLALTLTGGVYQFSKPLEEDDSEFMVINSLPVPDTILQKANVNLNIFVDDILTGTPDSKRLKELLNEVLTLFPFAEDGSKIQAYLKDTGIIADSDYNRHYVNVRMEVMMLND